MQQLFGMSRDGKTLADYCERRKADMEKAVRHWNADELLAMPDQEITDYLISEYAIPCPVLRHDWGTSTEPEPLDLPAYSPVPGMGFGSIPFDGDKEVFYRRPSPFRAGELPDIEVRTGEVRITWQQADGDTSDSGQINAHVTKQVGVLQFYLNQSAAQLDMFNRELAAQAARLVAARKQRLELDRDVNAKLLYPLRRRPDATRYQFPLTRRSLTPRPRPSAAPGKPEYELADAAFEDVLKVLRHSRNALERSPSLTAQLHEEQIRFILLVSQAISQLLNDLTWRDTKGTLLLFIRNLDVTAVISKAVKAIREHPNHVATRPASDPADRHDFVLHANGDPEKKLHLAFLPFALGPAKTKEP